MEFDKSLLSGSNEDKTLTAEDLRGRDYYVLGLGENGVRFYKAKAGSKIEANKAYILIEKQ